MHIPYETDYSVNVMVGSDTILFLVCPSDVPENAEDGNATYIYRVNYSYHNGKLTFNE